MIVPELEAAGMLSKVDRAALAGYCTAYSRWRRAESVVSEKGFSYQYLDETFKQKQTKRPEVQIAIDSLNQVKSFCAEFGLTPSSRVRLATPGTGKKTEDALEKILAQGKNN